MYEQSPSTVRTGVEFDVPHGREGLMPHSELEARKEVDRAYSVQSSPVQERVAAVDERGEIAYATQLVTSYRSYSLDSTIHLGITNGHSQRVRKGIIKKALSLLTGDLVKETTQSRLGGLSERELIQLESKIGGELFGPVPADHRRDFFCLDNKTWIWHEEWTGSETGPPEVVTTRYEVHDNGILKAQEGRQYHFIEGEELSNLHSAIRMYYDEVARRIYGRDPRTGQSFSSAVGGGQGVQSDYTLAA